MPKRPSPFILTIPVVALLWVGLSWSRGDRPAHPASVRSSRRFEPVFQKGVSLSTWGGRGIPRGEYETLGRQAVVAAKGCGVEWVQVVPYGYQPSVTDPDLQYRDDAASLRALIGYAHGQGL
ncbi:MAG: hypothetical protein HY710_02435, partial [Candidatus Latescibacteria bacterium]|nr:hypothetical protein [Candidatus Latescibacterota bacterium]